jgi:type I restriction enzyme S subunit
MNNWEESLLGDFVTHKKGFAFKSQWFVNQGIPVVKVTDFTASSIDVNNLDYVEENIALDKTEYQLKTGDSVIQTVGSWPNNPASVVGKVVKVPVELNGALLNQNAVILRSKKGLDKSFLFYLLQSEGFKGFIINMAQGASNQASITLDSIFRFPFNRPPLALQRNIATIISSYDDLIATNNKRIATLEQLAQQIYKEWFVRMRFPGWENTPLHHGIPDEWEEVQFSELVIILSGGTPSTNIMNYWNGDILFFTPKDANTDCFYVCDSEKKITEQGLENCNSRLYEPNTVFITARGSVGKVNLNTYAMAMNQSCFALKGKKDIPQSFLFFATKASVETMKCIANGATFDAITIDSFSRFKSLKPTNCWRRLKTDHLERLVPIEY